ncbi:MarR family transcriptional regulator [Ancylobacter sp. 6x-1]|uniref:MarR family transcriptional regulator n=1 Tax=Ancylobacter crimeensis TaxID=2579147 RepID=A0ABT0D6H3_9HYPH|nr:MarR family transcriptional regulator [Ancylobacter crimeensis]MCK0195548.1 MarR family transcriptional regulator [Ancylobacter crimeensis]
MTRDDPGMARKLADQDAAPVQRDGARASISSFPGRVNDVDNEQTVTHLEIARVIERAHRRFLDLLRMELIRLGTDDISPSQVMLLFTIGSDELSVRDLLERGHYLGSNASYNLKQLVDGGYVDRSASPRDRRSARLRLTEKAVNLCEAIRASHDNFHRQSMRDESEMRDLVTAYNVLRRLELLWTSSLRYGGDG